jgi:aerobic carbon-monoxide dehydrogenase large subunit
VNDSVISPVPAGAGRFGSGQAVRRIEDDALLAGHGRYTDDIRVDGQAQVAFSRSPYPHARILSIDTAAAAAMPGVRLVVTGADLVAAGIDALPGAAGFVRADGSPAATAPRRPLAHERVRFVGEPVVAVIADTLQQARDAAEAVMIDYEALPMAIDPAQAMAPGAPVLCEAAPDNISCEMRHGSADATAAAFAKAAHVVKLDIVNQRLAAVTIEPRSILADFDTASGRTTIHMSTQMPSGVRDTLCDAVLKIPRDQIRVRVPDVGGGFGMKTGIYPEDAVVVFAARALKQPVKWIADRSEEFLSTTHGRDVHVDAQLALAADGRILALKVHSLANVGAYGTGVGVAIQLLIGPWVQTSIYDIQTIDFHFKAVMTNTAPTGAYRGAGRPEAIHNMERLMDEAARQIGMDRIALRRRNFIQPEQMPYTNPMGQTYDTGRFEHVMDQGLALADWAGFEARAAESKRRGKLRGLGIATFLEWTGGNALEENVQVSVSADGFIELTSATMAMGQGIATSYVQLAHDVFGVPLDRIRVLQGDTDRANGFGSAGSRSLFTGGGAVQVASERTVEHAKELAGEALEVAPADIEYRAGRFSVVGTDLGIGLFDLAAKQAEARIRVEASATAGAPSWPNACHVCEVEIDPATGDVRIVAYASVNDIGRVVSPQIVRGQVEGGAVQGIGQALCERVAYDAESGQMLTASFMDYALPHADIFRGFKTEFDTSVPCLTNVLGAKGVGELGTIGATPAVVNAVVDALDHAGLGRDAERVQMPLTAERVWRALAKDFDPSPLAG